MPTIAMGPDDKDYAVSFACPSDAEGMFMADWVTARAVSEKA